MIPPNVSDRDPIDFLMADDSTLDKPYAKKLDPVSRPRPGKHPAVVEGIHLIMWLWNGGDRPVTGSVRNLA